MEMRCYQLGKIKTLWGYFRATQYFVDTQGWFLVLETPGTFQNLPPILNIAYAGDLLGVYLDETTPRRASIIQFLTSFRRVVSIFPGVGILQANALADESDTKTVLLPSPPKQGIAMIGEVLLQHGVKEIYFCGPFEIATELSSSGLEILGTIDEGLLAASPKTYLSRFMRWLSESDSGTTPVQDKAAQPFIPPPVL